MVTTTIFIKEMVKIARFATESVTKVFILITVTYQSTLTMILGVVNLTSSTFRFVIFLNDSV